MTLKDIKKLSHGIPKDAKIIFDTGSERLRDFTLTLQYDSELG